MTNQTEISGIEVNVRNLNLTSARAFLRAIGYSIRCTDGEFCVTGHGVEYFSNDLADSVGTAIAEHPFASVVN